MSEAPSPVAATATATAIRSGSVYVVFLGSGAAALVYQVLWSRWLSLAFGSTTASAAVVLGAFMAGLALGSRFAGRRLKTTRRPLRAYALVELSIGAFAVVFPLARLLAERILKALVDAGDPPATGIAVRVVLSFALLLVPTALMGATLPLLTEFFRRHPRASRGWKVGFLYAANTLGAAVGIAFTTLFLIELLGVWTTTMVAALLNAAIAATAWRLGRDEADVSTAGDDSVDARQPLQPAEQARGEAGPAAPFGRLAVGVLAVSGALALASEVLWMRTLQTLVGTSTYAFSTIVFVYLTGIAVGSAALARVVERLRDPATALVCALAFMGVWTPAAVALFQILAHSLDVAPRAPLSLWRVFACYFEVGVLIFPLALASGACFPLATRILNPRGTDAEGALIARAYAWNTWGAVFGSLAAGFAVAPWLDYFDALYAVGFAYLGAAVVCALVSLRASARVAVAAAGAVALVVLVLAQVGRPGYAALIAAEHDREVVMHTPGVQAVTTVVKRRGAKLASSLLVNGHGMTAKLTDTKMMAHVPLLLHPAPRDTLVICFGMGTTYRSALSHGGNVTVVELVAGVFDAFPYFYEDAAAVRNNPRGRMIVDDGRNYLELTDERFDVITLDPPPPIDGAGVNNLYSRDFAELAKAHLKPGGVVAHWIPFVGTWSGVDDQQTFVMLVDTFAGAFPHVYTIRGLNGVGLHVVGALEPLAATPDSIRERIGRSPAVAADLSELEPVSPSYFAGIEHVAAPEVGELIVTDDRPLLEFYFVRTALSGGTKPLAHHMW